MSGCHEASPSQEGRQEHAALGNEDALFASISSETLATAALLYARLNWEVFPLVPGEKRPLTNTGFHAATSDPDQIAAFWKRWPDANIGLSIPEGIVVIDVDGHNDGHLTLASLDAQGLRLPLTLSSLTGNGAHLWYRSTDDRLRQGSNVLGPGIDTRLPGRGYVVAPPSIHPCGRTYRWINTRPAEPLPDWASTKLRRQTRTIRTIPGSSKGGSQGIARLVGMAKKVAESKRGERNSHLNWASYRARELGVDSDLVIRVLTSAAMDAGLSRAEAERTIRSGYGRI